MSEQTPRGRARAGWDVSAPPAFAVEALPAPPGVLVLQLSGELDVATSPVMRGHVDRALSGSVRSIVLDLEDVGFVDSSALRELIRAQAAFRDAGGVVALVAPRPPVLRLLELTGTGELFAVVATREEALALASSPASTR